MSKCSALLLLVVVVLCIVIYVMANRPRSVTTTTSTVQVDTVRVTHKVYVPYWREKVITEIDTVYMNGHEHIIARYRDRIDTNRVVVDLNIAYHEYDRTFDVKADVTAEIDTVYITKTITNDIVSILPPKPISFTGGMMALIADAEGKRSVNAIGLDAGIRIKGKYDASFMVSTDGMLGIRIGIAF